MREFPQFAPLALSEKGQMAYVVKERQEGAYANHNSIKDHIKVPNYISGCKICLSQGNEIRYPDRSCWNPSWSPDGNSLAFLSDAEGRNALFVYSVTDQTSRRVCSTRLHPIQIPLWSPDGKEIYVHTVPDSAMKSGRKFDQSPHLSFSYPEKEKVDLLYDATNTSELVAVDIASGTERLVKSLRMAPFNPTQVFSPSGTWIAYTSGEWVKDTSTVHGILWDVNVIKYDGSALVKCTDSIPLDCHYQDFFIVWHPTEDSLYFISNQKLWKATFSSDGLTSCTTVFSHLGNFDPAILSLTKDGSFLIVRLESSLALLPLDGDACQTITLPEEWIFNELLTNSEKIVLGVTNKQDPTLKAILQYDVSSKACTALWEGCGTFSHIHFHAELQEHVGVYEDFNHPPEICTLSGQALSKIEPALYQVEVGTLTYFDSLVPDGNGEMTTVKTGLILPPGYKKGDMLPTIVVQYPGSDSASSAGRYFAGGDDIGGLPMWYLNHHGFAILLPNLVLGDSAIGNPLQAMTDRLLPQVYQAAHLGLVDINRLGIMGQSYGGYGTVGIISCTSLFKAAVATNGTYDIASFTHHLNPDGRNLWMTWAEKSQGRMGKPLFDDPLRYISNSPFYRADKIHTPLLLIHGLYDDAHADAEKLFSALRALKKPVDLVLYKKGDHVLNWMRKEDHRDALDRILHYFHQHLD